MRQLIFLFALFMIYISNSFGQNQKMDIAKLQAKIPQEKVYVHYNSSILFPGEYLYYKLYTLNQENEKLSGISKIAYIELIDSSGKSFVKHKVILENGLGQGDFFIPTSLKSGNYRIVSYTKWMRNGGSKNYYSGNLTIINPYRNDQEAILSKSDTVLTHNTKSEVFQRFDINNDFNIEFTEKSTYGKREMVSFDIQNLGESKVTGDFSISIRKSDNLNLTRQIPATNYLEAYSNNVLSSNQDSTFLPDLRGDFYSGKIIPKNKLQERLNIEKIAISVPGDNFSLKLSETDNTGNFYFIMDENDYGDEIFIQVAGDNRNNYNIDINHQSVFDFSQMEFDRFEINEEMRKLIIERSVYNQIENGYYSAKPDTLRTKQDTIPFYGLKNAEIYNLDDYTRFKTVKETFVEVITNAKIRSDREGKAVFEVYPLVGAQNLETPALLLVDGLYIQDTQRLIDYDALKIEEVKLVRHNYYYGTKVFQGIIAIQTKDNDFLEGFTKDFVSVEKMIIPQLKKFYFKADYSQNKSFSKRIPDFRLQLLWEPNFMFSSDFTNEVKFYTSDVTGDYKIFVEGFTSEGKPVSLSKRFTVE